MAERNEEAPEASQSIVADHGGVIHDVRQNIKNIKNVKNVFVIGPGADVYQQNRKTMLLAVKTIWVDGVLKDSLTNLQWIDLDLEERPEAVEKPLAPLLRVMKYPTRQVMAPGTTIGQVFDQANGSLLILGDPGAGKTTALLSLAKTLVERAEKNKKEFIPVILHLSEWPGKKLDFETWLVARIHLRYSLRKEIARHWLETGQLALLLDGLNELKAEYRSGCLQALNAFHKKFGRTAPLAVCCRVEDYRVLPLKARVGQAIYLCRASTDQVVHTLTSGGESLQAIARALKEDPVLQELAQTPLMLRMIVTIYADEHAGEILSSGPLPARRNILFDAYVRTMFTRALPNSTFSESSVKRFLVWLAGGMARHNPSIFYIESLQPGWLASRARWLSYLAAVLLSVALAVGLVNALAFAISGGGSLAAPVGAITACGIIVSSLLGRRLRRLYAIALAAVLMAVLASPVLTPLGGGVFGLLIGLQTGLAGTTIGRASVTEKRVWSWRRAIPALLGGMLLMLLVTYLSEALAPTNNQTVSLAEMLAIALPFGMPFMLVLGWENSLQMDLPTMPNQGFWKAARNTLQTAAICVLMILFSGTLILIVNAFSTKDQAKLVHDVLKLCISLTLLTLPPVILSVGGIACIQHLALRAFLLLDAPVPWNISQILDEAAGRSLLQKAGGGYQFMHPLLLEYFLFQPYLSPGGSSDDIHNQAKPVSTPGSL